MSAFLKRIPLLAVLSASLLGTAVDAGVLYVKADTAGANNGSSWANAFTSLQSALTAAQSGDQIWVAAGTYYPSTDASGVPNPADPRTKTFAMKTGVAVYGGFAGTETAIEQRSITANATTLSGDIGTPADTSDNCYNVATMESITDARLDGFTVTAGNADGDSWGPCDAGGGIYVTNLGSSNTIANCTVSGNSAGFGGGLYCTDFSPVLTDCTISGNSVAGYGGGLYCSSSSSVLTNCLISGNSAFWDGGGFCCSDSSSVLTNCTVSGNSASYGGGLDCRNASSPTLTNCILHDNTRQAIFEDDTSSDPVVRNCLFQANPDGDYYDCDTSSTLTGAAALNALTGNSGNVDGDPMFAMDGPSGIRGTWTAVFYRAATGRTTLTDAGATFTPGALVGRLINPNTGQRW